MCLIRFQWHLSLHNKIEATHQSSITNQVQRLMPRLSKQHYHRTHLLPSILDKEPQELSDLTLQPAPHVRMEKPSRKNRTFGERTPNFSNPKSWYSSATTLMLPKMERHKTFLEITFLHRDLIALLAPISFQNMTNRQQPRTVRLRRSMVALADPANASLDHLVLK